MLRRIIRIDEERCNGCGLCAEACHEGAIGMRDGKAKLLREDYCDGLGDCLPACPVGAISFEEREAAAYDEAAVQAARRQPANAQKGACGAEEGEGPAHAGGCPGARARELRRGAPVCAGTAEEDTGSALGQWPVQLKLVPVRAPYFSGAHLLVAADCTAFACGDFHTRFLQGRIALIGCPKLDSIDYTQKLAAILRENDVRSLTVVRMEVPCCGGIARAAQLALAQSGKTLPLRVWTIATDGRVLDAGD